MSTLLVRAALSTAMIASLAVSAQASSSNSPEYYRGVQGVVSCTACHIGGGAANSGPGSMRIEGMPAVYVPGQRYPIRIVVAQTGFKKWGFQAWAADSDGKQSGKILSADPSMDLKISQGMTFVKSSLNGMESLGPVRSWSFVWEAPASGTASINAQGVAADGSNNVNGDFSYSTTATSAPVSAGSAD